MITSEASLVFSIVPTYTQALVSDRIVASVNTDENVSNHQQREIQGV
jgi:hypothetical protein